MDRAGASSFHRVDKLVLVALLKFGGGERHHVGPRRQKIRLRKTKVSLLRLYRLRLYYHGLRSGEGVNKELLVCESSFALIDRPHPTDPRSSPLKVKEITTLSPRVD